MPAMSTILAFIFLILIISIINYNSIYISYGESWNGQNFVSDAQTFGEPTWEMNANCAHPAIMYGYVQGPTEIKFKWRKSTSYGSAFEFNLTIEGLPTKLICPSFNSWNENSFYINDNNIHKIILEYGTKLPAGKTCNMQSSAWWAITTTQNLNKSAAKTEYIPKIEILPSQIDTLEETNKNNSDLGIKSPATTYNLYINSSNIIINYINSSDININVPTYPNGYNTSKEHSPLIINLSEPESDSYLYQNCPIEFKFTPNYSKQILSCALLIDGKERNRTNDIQVNKSNKILYAFNRSECGGHNWEIICNDCQDRVNSSKINFFHIKLKNDTTRVNVSSCDPSKFIYNNISQAITNVTENGTVIIEKGVFHDPIVIIKPLRLEGSKDSLIDLQNENEDAINIKSNYITLCNLNITNCRVGIISDKQKINNIALYSNLVSNCTAGFDIEKCKHLNINGSTIKELREGAIKYDLDGIILKNCMDWDITNNTINAVPTKDLVAGCISFEGCGSPGIIKRNKFYNACSAIFLYDDDIAIDENKLKKDNTIAPSVKQDIIISSEYKRKYG